MATFDPDAYLAKTQGFDPDAYLARGTIGASNVVAAPSPLEGMSGFKRLAAGVGKSFSDVGVAAKQRLDEAAAGLESLIPGGAALSQLTGGKTAQTIRDEGLASVKEMKRRDAPLMQDPAGFTGNLLGGIGMGALASPLGPVASGAAMGYLTPSEEGAEGAIKNTLIGGGAGYLGDKAIKAVARLVQPKVDPNVKALLDQGIRLTPGQAAGGLASRIESKSTSLPFVGDAISAAQRRGGADLNRVAFDRALAPIGMKLPAGVTGRDAVQYADDALGAAYDRLLPKMTTQADNVFAGEVQNLRQMMSTGAIDPKYADTFERIVKARVLDKFQGQQAMTGETMKAVESHLTKEIARFRRAPDPDANLMADALQEVQSSLRGLVMRNNPQFADELKSINTGWANFKRVQRAAAGLGTDEGVFTPAQLENAVKAMDRSKDKARFAEGRALMQDLSGPAKSVMGSKYPDSGTAGRMMNVGGLASYFLHPGIPAGLIGGAAAYSTPVQSLIVKAMTQRPDYAPMLAESLRAAAPLGGLLSANLALDK